jgi:hypothetical protein
MTASERIRAARDARGTYVPSNAHEVRELIAECIRDREHEPVQLNGRRMYRDLIREAEAYLACIAIAHDED